jgi:hypothetical protein
VTYVKQGWQNVPATVSSLSADRLLHMEDGIESATVTAENAAATLATHTVEYFQDLVANMVRAGTNVAVSYDDAGGLLTISASGGGGTGSVTIAGITDATSIGKALLAATSNAQALTAIGAQPAGDYVLTAGLNTAVDSRIGAAKAAPNGLATLDGSGVLTLNQLPAAALTVRFTAISESAMLALNAQPGDVAQRTDLGRHFYLVAAPAATLANWVDLGGGGGTGGQVSSVNSKTGSVVLTKADIGLTNVDNTADTAKPVSTPQATAIAVVQGQVDAIEPIDYNGTAWPTTRPAAWGTSPGVLRSTKFASAPTPPAWTIDGDLWIRHPDAVA